MLRTIPLCLLAAAIAGSPLQTLAQNTNKAAAAKPAASDQGGTTAKKKGAHPFRGKLVAVDQTAKTIQIGTSTYQITSQTKVTKAGKPATLADGVVGEEAAGYAKPSEDGKMIATSVRFGPKPAGTSSSKKTDQPQK